MERSTKSNLPLPEELVRDIFLRLPVKTLWGCKGVCKEWCALIESPSFVNQHFCQESNRERLLLRVGIFAEPEPEPEPHQEVYNALDVDEEPEFEDPELEELAAMMPPEPEEPEPYPEGYKYALSVDETFSEYEEPCHLQMPDLVSDLIGPLNGVFCVVSDMWPWGPSALLNAATRQFKPLPLLERVELPNRSLFGNELGFGLDPLTGDYKLVLILYFLHSYHEDYQCVVSVCTSDSDSWRLLEDVDPNISSRRVNESLCNKYLNGVYYWLLEFNHTSDVALLAFDMRTEKFKEIHVMGSVSQSNSGFLALRGDSLVLLMYETIDRCIDVWIMLNEGSWIRSSRVGPVQEDIRWPLYFWKNNELLVETVEDSFLNSYNVFTQELRALKVKRTDGFSYLRWVFIYKESLVSIKGEAGKCKLWDPSSDFIKDFFKNS